MNADLSGVRVGFDEPGSEGRHTRHGQALLDRRAKAVPQIGYAEGKDLLGDRIGGEGRAEAEQVGRRRALVLDQFEEHSEGAGDRGVVAVFDSEGTARVAEHWPAAAVFREVLSRRATSVLDIGRGLVQGQRQPADFLTDLLGSPSIVFIEVLDRAALA